MKRQTKTKIQKIVFGIISGTCFAICGGFIGFFGARLQIQSFAESKMLYTIVMMLVSAGIMIGLYFLSLCFHEVGHLIFGLISGYSFESIRFGSLMITKENGKIKFSKYSLPGTGGQCIMEPPSGNPEDMPVFLYNMGGLFVNLSLALMSGLLAYCFGNRSDFLSMVLIGNLLVNLACFVTNGIPFTEIGNDGANTLILCRNKKARVAFYNSLKIIEFLSKGIEMGDMPKELFEFDETDALDNPLTVSQAVNSFNYFLNTNQFCKAKEVAEYILEKATSINHIHEGILNGEQMYIAAVIDKEIDKAKKIYNENQKSFKSLSSFISMQRCLYAYYKLVDVDEKLSDKYQKAFEKSVQNYPYKVDAQNELRLFNLVVEKI